MANAVFSCGTPLLSTMLVDEDVEVYGKGSPTPRFMPGANTSGARAPNGGVYDSNGRLVPMDLGMPPWEIMGSCQIRGVPAA